jgi:hypothetical protein
MIVFIKYHKLCKKVNILLIQTLKDLYSVYLKNRDNNVHLQSLISLPPICIANPGANLTDFNYSFGLITLEFTLKI